MHHEIKQQAGKVSRRRQYLVYLPADYSPARHYPLLMVLHGCLQNHEDMRSISGFDAIADRVGAVVVYPFVTSYSGHRTRNCWGWWLNRQRQRGRGEVSDLRQIALDVSEQYSIDANRRHICGLSAGGAMSIASLAAYSDFWTSGASVAGVPYGESSRSVSIKPYMPASHKSVNTLSRILERQLVAVPPPMLAIQSTGDRIVSPVLAENLRDTWIRASHCKPEPDAVLSNVTHGNSWSLDQYCAGGRLQVGHFLINDIEHAWPGGKDGAFSVPDAPNVSELIWAFFDLPRVC